MSASHLGSCFRLEALPYPWFFRHKGQTLERKLSVLQRHVFSLSMSAASY